MNFFVFVLIVAAWLLALTLFTVLATVLMWRRIVRLRRSLEEKIEAIQETSKRTAAELAYGASVIDRAFKLLEHVQWTLKCFACSLVARNVVDREELIADMRNFLGQLSAVLPEIRERFGGRASDDHVEDGIKHWIKYFEGMSTELQGVFAHPEGSSGPTALLAKLDIVAAELEQRLQDSRRSE